MSSCRHPEHQEQNNNCTDYIVKEKTIGRQNSEETSVVIQVKTNGKLDQIRREQNQELFPRLNQETLMTDVKCLTSFWFNIREEILEKCRVGEKIMNSNLSKLCLRCLGHLTPGGLWNLAGCLDCRCKLKSIHQMGANWQ